MQVAQGEPGAGAGHGPAQPGGVGGGGHQRRVLHLLCAPPAAARCCPRRTRCVAAIPPGAVLLQVLQSVAMIADTVAVYRKGKTCAVARGCMLPMPEACVLSLLVVYLNE